MGIWKVKNNLKTVINYIDDEKKIDSEIFNDLHKELEYITNDDKTEKKLYSSAINCSLENAYEEMIKSKEQWLKTDGILAFHSYQSFKEGEVTPELAHNIGLELANKMWGDRFQVVVSTHLNTNHIHNHFVINSVSFLDGKRYYDNRESYARLRKLNDEICKEHGLSYLNETITRKGIDYTKYQNINYSNYYSKTKKDIDYFISISNNFDEFINNLKVNNYNVIVRANKLSVRHKDYRRNIRIERKYGNDYTIENIVKRIKGIYLPEKTNYKKIYKKDKMLETLLKTNSKSLAYLYIKYLKLLNKYPKSQINTKLSYELKQEINRMDMISKETNLLVDNNIESREDLDSFYMKLDKTKDVETIKLCEDIFRRNDTLKNNIEKLEKEVIYRE